ALFCFDYCLIFTREVQRIWKLKHAPSAIIFYCVRYPSLFSTLFVILEQTRWSGISDEVTFSALRAYALSGQKRWALAVVLCLGSVNPLISLVSANSALAWRASSPSTGITVYLRGIRSILHRLSIPSLRILSYHHTSKVREVQLPPSAI
ncbi:hypothetical protein C8Q73DRAFT_639740, partial [Cubamyces lactineus]